MLPSFCDRSCIQTKKKTHKKRRHIKYFIISPQKEYKRGTGVTDWLKIVLSRGNCRIYHKKTCENNSSGNKKSKDSVRKLRKGGICRTGLETSKNVSHGWRA